MQHFKIIAVVNQNHLVLQGFQIDFNRVRMNKMLQSTLVIHWMMSKLVKMTILMKVFPSINATAC